MVDVEPETNVKVPVPTALLDYERETAAECRIDLVRTSASLQALEPEWRRLYERSAPRNPFLSHEWVTACQRHLCDRAELFVVTARAGGELVGAAPLRLERRLGFRVLRFIGKGFSPYVGFLRDPEHPGVEAMLLDGLAQERRHWDLLSLTQLTRPFTALHEIPSPKTLRGQVRASPWRGSAYVAFDGDWDQFVHEGPGWLKRAERKSRHFQRQGGTVHRYLGREALPHVAEIAEVEKRSWQGQYGQPEAVWRRALAVLGEAFETLSPRREIELWLARMGERTVAYEVNLLTPEKIWLYRGAYDQATAQLSAGTVLDLLSVREAWHEGRREYDYMSGDESYKVQRTNAVRPMLQLTLHPAGARGSAAFLSFLAARGVMEKAPKTRPIAKLYSRLTRRQLAAPLPN